MSLSAVIRSAVAGVKAYFRRSYDIESLTDLDNFSPHIHNHLLDLYSKLFYVTLWVTIGLYINLAGEAGGPATIIGFVGSMFFLFIIPQQVQALRKLLLFVAALSLGASFIPYTQPYLNFIIDPRFIFAVLSGYGVCFGCYAIVACWKTTPGDKFGIYYNGTKFSCMIFGAGLVIAFFYFNFFLVLLTCIHLLYLTVYLIAYSQEMVVKIRTEQEFDYVNSIIRLLTDSLGVTIHGVILTWKFMEREGLSAYQLGVMVVRAIGEKISARRSKGSKDSKRKKRS